jgi:hypothetical protein
MWSKIFVAGTGVRAGATSKCIKCLNLALNSHGKVSESDMHHFPIPDPEPQQNVVALKHLQLKGQCHKILSTQIFSSVNTRGSRFLDFLDFQFLTVCNLWEK